MSRQSRLLLVLGLLWGSLLFLPVTGEPKAARVSIAPFYNDKRPVCTAWSLSKKTARWVTALHCLGQIDEEENPGEPMYMIQDQVATVEGRSVEDDLAVLTTPEGVSALRLAGRAPLMGDVVHTLGFPLGLQQLFYTVGQVANPRVQTEKPDWRRGMWIALPGCKGHSGAPVLNTQEEVVSVVQRGPTAEYCDGFVIGPTWETLVSDLKQLAR